MVVSTLLQQVSIVVTVVTIKLPFPFIGGKQWTVTSAPSTSSPTYWASITSDGSGTRLVAAQNPGGIYISSSGEKT